MDSDGFDTLRVMVVDSNRHMRTLVKGLLHAFRIRDVIEAADGADAFKQWRTFPTDVIITELMMTPLDGLDFVRLVRTADDSPNCFVPVIMVTGYTERHWVEQARDAGVSEFLAKPVSAEALYARLHAAVHRPRAFVRSHAYTGPDRRRRDKDRPGPDRRKVPLPDMTD